MLGVANDSRIAGVFIARGQGIMPVVQVAPDWESYAFTKLDLENAEQKAFFEAALAWDLVIDGKKWIDGKAVCLLRLHPVLELTFFHSSSKIWVCGSSHSSLRGGHGWEDG